MLLITTGLSHKTSNFSRDRRAILDIHNRARLHMSGCDNQIEDGGTCYKLTVCVMHRGVL
ncbi:hypothetical protein KC19_VG038700 [Ceratodon purpureus]|uniref:Uncharacterized protein n=1 Tax=Ceratodon purpureus TaxID=3225 RepID=A0A8T0HLP2_CERPU|nr:hypothetical protein KC19_VG038700 [Ceratodon purpureus]